ncbi:glycosyltransferase involved in cell wall biosynthesis [Pedobacter sp. CG_S7]|uniref:glycosyltransferase family 4 protein n=1 Tax=Pedobacter sp. CG_S7 TaxID=3143930 RepID=UPI0033944D32
MLKLLIDHQTFSMQKYGGISRYFTNIQHSLEQREDIQSKVGILYTPNHYLKEYPAPLNNALGRLLLKKSDKCYKWNKQYSKYLMLKNNYDVLHPSYYHPYFLKYNKKPFVITVHDMIHELFPEHFVPNDINVKYKRICVENAAHIIAISESTKQDLINILQVDPQRITVIHHGYQMNTQEPSGLQNTYNNTSMENYILFVGDRKSYKNFPVLLTSIHPLLAENKEMKLYCAGGGSFTINELEIIKHLNLENKILQFNATDQELKSLYQNALAFVFPSLYEGFGLPILEAFKNNCPVIASDNACFREIGGNAISYFDPYDLNSILCTIKEVVTNSLLAKTIVKNGKLRLKKFSMQSCMDKTITVYQSLSK